ncbi:MAG: N-acetylmuramoyl-L-alanine amidase [Alistipes sp.]
MKFYSTFTAHRGFFIIFSFLFLLLGANEVVGENIAPGVHVVVIDAGHGGMKYPGASYRGIYEKDINLQVALALGRMIETEMPEIKVVYTRKTDKHFSLSLTEDLQARADIANRAEADLFIAIHANAARSTTAYGVETLIMGESPMEMRRNESVLYANNKEEFLDMSNQKTAAIVRAYIQNLRFTYGEYSEAMARILQHNYAKAGRHTRGVKRQPLKVLYATDMPGILTEIGFMSNPNELAYITSEKGQQEIARVIFKSVKDYAQYVQGLLLIETVPEDKVVDDDENENGVAPVEVPPTATAEGATTSAKGGAMVKETRQADSGFTIQLFASTKQVSLKSASMKNQQAIEFHSTGVCRFKYCTGRFATREEAQKQLTTVRKEFQDAFVVRYEGDKIVK